MINFWTQVVDCLDRDGVIAIVSVTKVDGSTPREAGARMAVTTQGRILGTVGGGAFEFAALNEAVTGLSENRFEAWYRDWPLGPELGQCCGGRVRTLTEIFTSNDRAELLQRVETDRNTKRTSVMLFGAGHVGRAIVLALAPLPFDVEWIDSRADAFPSLIVQTARPVVSDAPAREMAKATMGTFVLIVTHSHALDLEITETALKNAKLAYIGLIGSETKRARFERRLTTLGVGDETLVRLHCPIGLPGISGKEPATIAASVAADLLLRQEGLRKQAEQASFRHEIKDELA